NEGESAVGGEQKLARSGGESACQGLREPIAELAEGTGDVPGCQIWQNSATAATIEARQETGDPLAEFLGAAERKPDRAALAGDEHRAVRGGQRPTGEKELEADEFDQHLAVLEGRLNLAKAHMGPLGGGLRQALGQGGLLSLEGALGLSKVGF